MSASGINYYLMESFGSNERLAAYFDFTRNYSGDAYSGINDLTDVLPSSSERVLGSPLTGVVINTWPAYDTSKFTGYLSSNISSNESTVISFTTGVFEENKLELTNTNLAFDIDGINLNDMSLIVDFEFGGQIKDGVIFGSFEKSTETIKGESYTGSKGFNVGVTSRGHLFFQCFGTDGDKIVTLNSELSKRNLIGVSSYGTSVVLSNFDYINNEIDSVEIVTQADFLANSDYFYFGGSKNYYRRPASSAERFPTFDGNYLNNLAIFSGAVSEDYLYSIGSGFLGDYSYTAPIEYIKSRTTGFLESITYRTGITGYEYYVTGTLEIATGREYVSGQSLTEYQSNDYTEGERYYKYYSLNGVGESSQVFYKEEVGHLHSGSGYFYLPTGTEAYDTLGLTDASSSVQDYIISNYTGQETITINLYGKRELTGTLNEISGVTQTPLTENYSEFTDAVSGIELTGLAQDFKKNFIYYMGERL